jgi:Sperm-tail PG-rich repeat
VNRNRPGPGAYETVDVDKARRAEPQFSFGNEKRPALGRNKDQLAIPGPANYNAHLHDNSVLKAAPSFGIGTSSRDDSAEKKKVVPGPGSYEH